MGMIIRKPIEKIEKDIVQKWWYEWNKQAIISKSFVGGFSLVERFRPHLDASAEEISFAIENLKNHTDALRDE